MQITNVLLPTRADIAPARVSLIALFSWQDVCPGKVFVLAKCLSWQDFCPGKILPDVCPGKMSVLARCLSWQDLARCLPWQDVCPGKMFVLAKCLPWQDVCPGKMFALARILPDVCPGKDLISCQGSSGGGLYMGVAQPAVATITTDVDVVPRAHLSYWDY